MTAQWVKVLAAKPEELRSVPEPTQWKERTYTRKFSRDLREPRCLEGKLQVSKCSLANSLLGKAAESGERTPVLASALPLRRQTGC